MEKALLRFEIEVVELGDFEDVVDSALMIVHICAGGDPNVVHVDSDGRAEGFMLENDVAIDVVHHGLKGRWQIGESEVHDGWFKKSISGFKRCLLLVSFTDAYVVVPPSDVELCVDMCITKIADKICNQGKRVLVSDSNGIDLAIILYWSQLAVFFVDEEE